MRIHTFRRVSAVIGGTLATLLLLGFAAPIAAQAKTPTTLDNLQTAYNGESNAHARYLAFAKKADEEGYAPVASLFRAAAKAEEIHAASHERLIKKMGGTPKLDLKTPEVKTTKENLQAAIGGESYERDTMYPDFIKLARQEKNRGAIEAFTEAKTAEAEHAKLYGEVLAKLDTWKNKTKKDFFVCLVCGYTVTAITFEKCPSCMAPKDKYALVK